jgi:hypothetical protein
VKKKWGKARAMKEPNRKGGKDNKKTETQKRRIKRKNLDVENIQKDILFQTVL